MTLGIALAGVPLGGGRNPVAALFSAGEQGGWWDPSDFSTMYQDSAGTTPVTAVGQPVGRINDKSGRGNHATQATAASRPTLSARYNLALSTEDITTATWTKSAGAASSASLFVPDSTNAIHRISHPAITMLQSASYVVTGRVKGAGVRYVYLNNQAQLAAGVCIDTQTASTVSTGASVSNITATLAADGYVDFSFRGVAQGAGPHGFFVQANNSFVATDTTYTGNSVDGFQVQKIDVRSLADAALNIPAYQRITTASDYDTAGFPHYLSYDGVDDSMATGSVDFSATDKMTVWVGVHKAAEGTGIIYELTADTSATNGALDGYTDTGGVLAYGLRATVAGEASTAPSVAAPASRVSTASYYLSGASAAERLQVRLDGVAQTLTGVAGPTTPPANFANAPLYFGRRGGSSLPFNGREYQTIIRGAASTASQIEAMEKFVAGKMGITL